MKKIIMSTEPESVDDKSLSEVISRKQDSKMILGVNPFSHSGHCIGPPSKISILV